MDSATDTMNLFFGTGAAPAVADATVATPVTPLEVLGALALAFALLAIIGWVYQRVHPGPGYQQDYVQTLIMLGMVVTVVIMVVSTRVHTALAVFAAFSIIRFRRNVSQSIDVGFIFLAMAIGLSIGAQEYGIAVFTTALVSLVVWLVSRLNLFAPDRPSHSLIIRVTPDIDFEQVLAEPFSRYVDSASLQSIQSVQAGLMTELHYAVRLRKDATPRDIVQAVRERNGNNRVMLSSAVPVFDDD
ncbi:MAG: DUF4956 domain-containing protein [Anaerolineae bacterium]